MTEAANNKERTESLSGWVNGMLGVLIFSGSLPATRLAVMDLDPFFLTFTRSSIAGLMALSLLLINRIKRPSQPQLTSLLVVALGVVIGFPLLTGLALQHISSAHSLVYTGLLPLCTALFGVLRGGERPRPAFWLFSAAGSLLVMGFALSGDTTVSATGDLLMLAAVIACGLGYAEGARLSRCMGGWQVISWSLVLVLPFMILASVLTRPGDFSHVGTAAWISLGYVSLFSMFLAFVFWYRGLVQGGIAAVGQLQLLQPFIGLCMAVFILHESVTPVMGLVSCGVLLCVAGSRKFSK